MDNGGPKTVSDWYEKNKTNNLFFCLPHNCLLTLDKCIARQLEQKVTEKVRFQDDTHEAGSITISAQFKQCQGCINWQYKPELPIEQSPCVIKRKIKKVSLDA
jgi:hypothetical protein